MKNLTVDLQPVELLDEVYIKLDGTPVDVEVKAVPFQYEGEHGVLVMLRDISSRKRAEAELHTAYERLSATEEELRDSTRNLPVHRQNCRNTSSSWKRLPVRFPGLCTSFMHSPAVQWDCIMSVIVQRRSLASARILMISSNGSPWHIDHRDRDAFLASVNEAVSLESPWDFTGRFIKPGGETIWVQGMSRPFVRGKEIVFSGFLLDITDRKRAEEELRLLKISVDLSADEVFWLDFDGNILYVNDAACRINGYSREEFLTMKIYDLNRISPARSGSGLSPT